MSIIVSIDVIKKTICTPAGEELVRYAEERGLTELSFDETIAHWKKLGKRNWAVWLYKNKAMFEKLANTQATSEEQAAYDADLDYLNQQTTYYVVNNIRYTSLSEAEQAREIELKEILPKTESIVVCSLETFNESGDSTWVVIDLDDFVPLENTPYKIKVFDPILGTYLDFTSLEEAKSKRNENMVKTADTLFPSAVINTIEKHPDFLNDNSDL